MTLVGTRIQRIEITGVLGEGGMGEVYVGYDEKLARQVALKRIRSEKALQEELKARFLREARILSQLNHPGICRIYDFIEADDGDYLVLELIDGSTLREVLAAGDHARMAMEIAQRIVEVLVAAHAEGVVHRDLKPDNVMLTGDGDIKVLDFGVARVVDRDDETAGVGLEAGRADLASLRAQAELGDQLAETTEQGFVVGTLQYMSPEQARGEAATTASDMYSFGLLLEELFDPAKRRTDSGSEAEKQESEAAEAEPPAGTMATVFDAEIPPLHKSPAPTTQPKPDRRTTLERAARGDREAVAGIDRDLSALIKRLKSFAPAARPTAVETEERLRWISERRQRRLRKLAIAAGILVAVAGGIKYTVDLGRERQVAIEARNQAEDLVSFMLQDLSDGLEPIGRLELLDQVSRQAIDYYDSVPAQNLVGESLFKRGLAFWRVAEVLRFQGDLPAALTMMQRAQLTHEQLTQESPDNLRWAEQLAADHRLVAEILLDQGNAEEAEVQLSRARAIHERLAGIEPEEAQWQVGLAGDLSLLGGLQRDRGELEAAQSSFEQALQIHSELVRLDPEDTSARSGLAQSSADLGFVLQSRGQLEEALEAFETAQSTTEQLLETDPTNAYWQNTLVNILSLVGKVHQAQGSTGAAIDAFQGALEIHGRLATEDPTDMRWQLALAWDWGSLSDVYVARGDLGSAQDSRSEAQQILRRLVERDPTNADWIGELAWESLQLGNIYAAGGRRSSAVGAWREAADAGAHLEASQRPDIASTRARALLRLGDVDSARPLVDTLVEAGWKDPDLLELASAAGLVEG